MFKKYKWLKWVVLAVVVIAGIWIYIASTASRISVRVAKAAIGEIAPAVSVSGEIKGNSAELSPKTIGVIDWEGVKEGNRVSRGQVIAKLDNYDTAKRDYESTRSLFHKGFATKQQLDLSRVQYESSCFISPINGIVTLVAYDVGESVSPGMTVFQIVDPKSAYSEVQIDESDIGDVRNGQEVRVFADAYPSGTFNGKLSNIGQEAELKKIGGRIKLDEEDKIFRARVDINDPEYKLKIGMTINADIITEKKPGLLIIPREAIFIKEDLKIVYVIKNNRAKETKVSLGAKDSANIEVRSGLASGDSVAVTGFDKLKDGSRVKIEKE